MKQIVNETVRWWPETTLDNMTSPFEETSPKFYTCMSVKNGGDTNCGIAHISGIPLMTSYSRQIYTCICSGNYQLYIVFPLGINLYSKQNIFTSFSDEQKSQ